MSQPAPERSDDQTARERASAGGLGRPPEFVRPYPREEGSGFSVVDKDGVDPQRQALRSGTRSVISARAKRLTLDTYYSADTRLI